MASDISSGGTSEFLAARKLFRANSINAKEEIEVFVEDEVDTIFWRHYFNKYAPEKSFKIKVLRGSDYEMCGKDALIEFVKIDSLGPNKLLAIDSDYDYIIDNYHTYSEDLRSCKYVINTSNTYSIENFKLVPSIQKEAIYLTSYCDQIKENIEGMLLQTSHVLYNLFTIHLFSTYKNDKVYNMSKFKSDVHKLTYINDKVSDAAKNYISQREQCLKWYICDNSEYELFLTQLKSKGINELNCWQYINGHTALEEIGVKIAANISCRYRGEYLAWIYANVSNLTRRDNLRNKYNNTTGVDNGIHQLKDRIREILYDAKPDFTWEPSIEIGTQIINIYKKP